MIPTKTIIKVKKMISSHKTINLAEENRQFKTSGGVSENNSHANFLPAFKDVDTGNIALSKYVNGRQAPFHFLDGLPNSWILKRDIRGRAVEIKSSIISGFIRLGKFFTRDEATQFMENFQSPSRQPLN